MPRPVAAIVDILEGALCQARRGNIQSLFILARDSEGDYAPAYETNDLDDLLYELGSEILRARIETARRDSAANDH